jgi:hypothetical protein
VDSTSPSAVRFGLVGALTRAASESGADLEKVIEVVARHCDWEWTSTPYTALLNANDKPGASTKSVLWILDSALRALEPTE